MTMQQRGSLITRNMGHACFISTPWCAQRSMSTQSKAKILIIATTARPRWKSFENTSQPSSLSRVRRRSMSKLQRCLPSFLKSWLLIETSSLEIWILRIEFLATPPFALIACKVGFLIDLNFFHTSSFFTNFRARASSNLTNFRARATGKM